MQVRMTTEILGSTAVLLNAGYAFRFREGDEIHPFLETTNTMEANTCNKSLQFY